MDKQEYINELESDISKILEDYTLNNYKKQIFAWKLKAGFKRTYNESYLWNRALFLTTNSSLLLQNNGNVKLATIALKECAEIYEYLSELPDISNKYDKEFLLILSALCYDLSGYQANAFCISHQIKDYILTSDNSKILLVSDNIIIEQIKYILLKRIPYANFLINTYDTSNDLGLKLFLESIHKWYEYILNLKEKDYISSLHLTYKHYLTIGNSYLSLLILLLETRLILFDERSIWKNLKKTESISNNVYWQKYVKLLTHDLYNFNNIKPIENRYSKFEFWTSQLSAIENGLMESDENFVVQMPTSAGKTFIAELLILKYLINFPEKKCLYIAPFRALTNEKEVEISQYFSKLGFSVSSLTGSYEIDSFQEIILNESDVLIATPEKVDLLLRIKPEFFNDVSFITVDEGHIIGNISARASLLEFLIIRLRIRIPTLRTLFISAVMPPLNAAEYAKWLSGNENNVLRSLQFKDSSVYDEWEPTRKLISSFTWVGNNGNINFQNIDTEDENTKIKQGATIYSFLKVNEFENQIPEKNNKTQTAAALAYKMAIEGNTLVFCAQPRQTEWIYKPLITIIKSLPETELPICFKSNTDKESYYYSNIWYGNDNYITEAIKFGIGIHFGDMPEQVRNAVENDFRNGKIRILLSSNTVGQGLNFPIKNLIFYSIQISQNKFIDIRDFWNIIGRAGRAGKETEGKIIFIINSDSDKRLFQEYTKKESIEQADSFFFLILQAFIANRLTEKNLLEYTSILAEPYLLDLVTQEIFETDFEDILQDILDNSLFKIQVDKRNFDILPLKESLRKIFVNFKETSTLEQIRTYAKTGFSFRSNKYIDDFIDRNINELGTIIGNDDYILLLKKFLELLNENSIEELKDSKLDKLKLNPIDFINIILKWIEGNNIEELHVAWKELNNKPNNLNIFISKALYYLYPWGITTFLTILAYKFKTAINELPEKIRNISSFIKYGINQSTACLACSLGIKNRQLSLFLYEKSNFLSNKDFIKWLSNLTSEEINDFDISKFDRENIHSVSSKLTTNRYRNIPSSFQFILRGTFYVQAWREVSKIISIGDKLDYQRDYNNNFDPYAIKILKNNSSIGFVPKEYAKVITSEIDINETKYDVIVTNVLENTEYNSIQVEMKIA